LDRLTFQEQIRSAYPDAFSYADGAIILDKDLRVVFLSDGASNIFGFHPIRAIDSQIEILGIKELTNEFLEKELDYFIDKFLLGIPVQFRGRPVHGGATLTGMNAVSKAPVHVLCGVHPLVLDSVMHLIVFFQSIEHRDEKQHAAALSEPASPFSTKTGGVAEQAIAVGNWLIHLKPKQIVVLLSIGTLVLVGLLLWRLDAVDKIIEGKKDTPTVSPSPARSPAAFETDKERVIQFDSRH
jgi:hypothetical protein